LRSLGGAVVFLLAVAAVTFLSIRFGLGRLPGDIVIDRGNFYVYVPFTTAIIVSVLLSLVLWLFGRR
jgi:hypothetical protein